MLDSVNITRRQSEIRQTLAELVGKDNPDETETNQMMALDGEYRSNEIRFRAALVAEDTERRDAGAELETREDRDRAELMAGFEVRQVVMALDEGRQLTGQTAEVVSEMRANGGYQGIPVPLEALETRAGETIASATPDPISTRPIIDRLFASTAAQRMGAQFINIPQGATEWPVVTSAVAAGWADGELADVAGPTAFATTDVQLKPDQTFGVQMEISRKAMKQSGPALEQAVRRDMNNAITVGLDNAVFQGTGANGQPLGVVQGASTYTIAETALDATPTWANFRTEVVAFMAANAANGPGSVRLAIRPEVWDTLDGAIFNSGSGLTEWDRLTKNIPASNIAISTNALAAPSGSPLESKALLTTNAGGLSPIFVGLWGGIDVIKDVVTLAASGQVKLTGLLTSDVTVPRASQLRVITDIQ